MSVTAPEPSDVPPDPLDIEARRGEYMLAVKADVRATVEHHAPCVPECPVCYPKGED